MSTRTRSARVIILACCLSLLLLAPSAPALAGKYSEEDKVKEMAEPRDDVATVYVIRKAGMGRAIYFWTFADEHFLGVTRGPGYAFAYLEPGTYTVWSRAENISALTLEVKAGETYYVWQKSLPGWGKARVRTELVSKEEGQELLDRVSRISRATDEGLEKAADMPARYLERAREKAAKGDDEDD